MTDRQQQFEQLQQMGLEARRNELMASDAYWNPNNPRHEFVKAQIAESFAAQYEGETHGRAPSAVVLDSTTSDLTASRQR